MKTQSLKLFVPITLMFLSLYSCGNSGYEDEMNLELARVFKMGIEQELKGREEGKAVVSARVANMEGDEIAQGILVKCRVVEQIIEELYQEIEQLKKQLIEAGGKQRYKKGEASYMATGTILSPGDRAGVREVFSNSQDFDRLNQLLAETTINVHRQINYLPKYDIHFDRKENIPLTTFDSVGIGFKHIRNATKASVFVQLQKVQLEALITLKAIHYGTMVTLSSSRTPGSELKIICQPQNGSCLKVGERFDAKINLATILLSDVPNLKMWVDEKEIVVKDFTGYFTIWPTKQGIKKHSVRLQWTNSKTGIADWLADEFSYEAH